MVRLDMALEKVMLELCKLKYYVTWRVTGRVRDSRAHFQHVQGHREESFSWWQGRPASNKPWSSQISLQTELVCLMQHFCVQLTQSFFCSYDKPPLCDVTLEEFETCALDRLRILAEIESSLARNRSWDELKSVTTTQCNKYLPLHTSAAATIDRESERRKDHLGHYVLRLAFCRSYVSF
jgi:hypothetical protein